MVKIQVNSSGKAYLTSGNKVLLAQEGGGDTISAINNSGSAISSGDKVFIAPLATPQSGANYEIIPAHSENNPTFGFVIGNGSQPYVDYTEKSIRSFYSDRYCNIYKVMDFSQPWEFNICFETGPYVGGAQFIYFGSNYNWIDSGLTIYLYDNKLAVAINDANELIVEINNYPVTFNTTYYVRVGWTGTQYYVKYSTDGSTWTDDVSSPITLSTPAVQSSTGVAIGNRPTTSNYFQGKIFMDKTYMKSGNTIQWQMYSDMASNISKDSYTGIAGENIASGSTGDIQTVLGE